jgi:hypothetical protein
MTDQAGPVMADPRSSSRPAGRASARNLLGVAAASLASFLVVLTLLSARLVSGRDPALNASASRSVLLSPGGRQVVRTTASGRVVAGAAAARSGAGAASRGSQPITALTRTSGGAAGGGERDG